MTVNVAKIDRALQLPDEWDSFAVDYFQTREFLDHTERFNPCQQRYYLLLANGCFQLGVAVYTLRLNLFTYRSIPSPVNVNIIGVPCSVSSSGIVGNLNLLADLFDYLKKHEKGLLMGLNLASAVAVPDLISGRTLPTVEIVNRFQGWEDYVHTLRSDYRRRFLMISRSFQGVKRMQGPCIQFDAEMYRLYLEVLNHSKGKLETLSLEFFKNLPGRFSLTAYFDQEMLLGWLISTTFRGKFYFFLGGINYQANPRFNTYFNMLFALVKEGIENGASLIDLGQTAEIPKTRLGGTITEKFMCGYHSNWLVRSALHLGRHVIEYSSTFPETRVFRDAP